MWIVFPLVCSKLETYTNKNKVKQGSSGMMLEEGGVNQPLTIVDTLCYGHAIQYWLLVAKIQ